MKKVAAEPPAAAGDVGQQDHLVLIYTSGTTGNPKGVVLSHMNALAVLNGIYAMGENMFNQTTLSFLPWSHVFGQVVEVHAGISAGCAVGIVNNRLREVHR
jgi:long-chain acyl-CoA synthetase